jgi:hypothetical protein
LKEEVMKRYTEMIATIQEFRNPNKVKRMIFEGDNRTLVLLEDSESILSKMVENF